jgi:hypothetical protein
MAHANCALRDPIWDWLVTNVPNSFAPKGRSDVELMGDCEKSLGFSLSVTCNVICPYKDCSYATNLSKVSHVVEYIFATNTYVAGDIARRIALIMNPNPAHRCTLCKTPITASKLTVSLSDFIFLQLGLHNYTNSFKPLIASKRKSWYME